MFAADFADDVHNFGDIGVGAALIDDGERGVEAFGEGAGALDTAGIGRNDGEFLFRKTAFEVFNHDGGGEEVIDGDVEEALNLGGVEIDREDAIGAGSFEHAGDQFCGDGHAGTVFAVLAGVAVIRQHGGNAFGAGALEGVEQQEKFHEVLVNGGAGGLDDEDVSATDVFLDLEVGFAVGKNA